MIQYFIDLPIEKQTWSVLVLSWLLVTVSAAIREKVKATECRNWARLMGVCGVALVSLQAIHATMLASELNKELMAKGATNVQQNETTAGTEIANENSVVSVASEYQAETKTGAKVSVVKYTDGRVRPVFTALGRRGLNALPDGNETNRNRGASAVVGRSDRSGDSLRGREF